ncbi:MAG: hypothetical protein K8823_1541 [Cenarchaeum symbiont of Oopsacas minuta]|nr:hypothetical protein [Cenarchaeum symbiont of Oopsacas minuta]
MRGNTTMTHTRQEISSMLNEANLSVQCSKCSHEIDFSNIETALTTQTITDSTPGIQKAIQEQYDNFEQRRNAASDPSKALGKSQDRSIAISAGKIMRNLFGIHKQYFSAKYANEFDPQLINGPVPLLLEKDYELSFTDVTTAKKPTLAGDKKQIKKAIDDKRVIIGVKE